MRITITPAAPNRGAHFIGSSERNGTEEIYAADQVYDGLACQSGVYCPARQKNRTFAVSRYVSGYLDEIPQLPKYATELAIKLLYDDAKVEEVVEGIQQDPSLASLVLKTVNSPTMGCETRFWIVIAPACCWDLITFIAW